MFFKSLDQSDSELQSTSEEGNKELIQNKPFTLNNIKDSGLFNPFEIKCFETFEDLTKLDSSSLSFQILFNNVMERHGITREGFFGTETLENFNHSHILQVHTPAFLQRIRAIAKEKMITIGQEIQRRRNLSVPDNSPLEFISIDSDILSDMFQLPKGCYVIPNLKDDKPEIKIDLDFVHAEQAPVHCMVVQKKTMEDMDSQNQNDLLLPKIKISNELPSPKKKGIVQKKKKKKIILNDEQCGIKQTWINSVSGVPRSLICSTQDKEFPVLNCSTKLSQTDKKRKVSKEKKAIPRRPRCGTKKSKKNILVPVSNVSISSADEAEDKTSPILNSNDLISIENDVNWDDIIYNIGDDIRMLQGDQYREDPTFGFDLVDYITFPGDESTTLDTLMS